MLGMSRPYERHNSWTTPEYKCWERMKGRCSNKSRSYYHGKGIKVCDRWLHSFSNFYADMGKLPSSKHSLDRINNEKDYTPENCRWATKQEQCINRRKFKNTSSDFIGVSFHKRDHKWYANIRKDILYYLGSYQTQEEAAYVRDQFALQLYGDRITLNFDY